MLISMIGYFSYEFKVDGFIFNDVEKIIYKRKPEGQEQLSEYFNEDNINLDGLVYLMIANETIHKINSNASTFVSESTLFPTLCSQIEEGGIGFDFRIQ